MRNARLKHLSVTLQGCLLLAFAVLCTESANALRMVEMPLAEQTKNAEPVARRLSLKLPLMQPVFHWTFRSEEELLKGRLVLHIDRGSDSTAIVIFEDGEFVDGWETMGMPNPKAGQAYFGFVSSKKYDTAPGDRLRVELLVKQDLEGIGPVQTGVLPAGTYRAEGSYSGLFDTYTVPPELAKLPEEASAKLRDAYEFKAFLEKWETQWPLRITGEEGWLAPDQRAAFEKQLQRMAEEEAKGQR